MSVTFSPKIFGRLRGSVSIADNAAGSPQTVSLFGAGNAPAVEFSPQSVTFGTQALGTAGPSQSVMLQNYGNEPLSIAKITVSPNFKLTSTTCQGTLAAGARCIINVAFAPTLIGNLSGTLGVSDNVFHSPQTVPLSGTGTAAELSATSLAFGNVMVHQTSAPQTVTLTNAAKGSISIRGIGIGGNNANAFSQTNNCPQNLSAGASCVVTVTFTPPKLLTLSATLNFVDNAGGSPQTVALSGTGVR